MINVQNTLFLRLVGPMQSWGTSSRFQLRRTDIYPSKSGVLGILLCAMGIRREDSKDILERLSSLLMGVRIDHGGTLDWDYHTAGAKIGIRSADGKIKKTVSTGEYEPSLSRRQYLYDASFLVALQGDPVVIIECDNALKNPVWPLFLGRKCCIPTEPVYAGTGTFNLLTDALSSVPWRSAIGTIEHYSNSTSHKLDAYIENFPGTPEPADVRLVYDVPVVFGFFSYKPRWIIKNEVSASVEQPDYRLQPNARRASPYSEHYIKTARPNRLKRDKYLCVFCKSPAVEVHHVSYENAGHETDSDLRSLCKLCHSACTMLEYGIDRGRRIDPSDQAQRPVILEQIKRLIDERHPGNQRKLLKSVRSM